MSAFNPLKTRALKSDLKAIIGVGQVGQSQVVDSSTPAGNYGICAGALNRLPSPNDTLRSSENGFYDPKRFDPGFALWLKPSNKNCSDPADRPLYFKIKGNLGEQRQIIAENHSVDTIRNEPEYWEIIQAGTAIGKFRIYTTYLHAGTFFKGQVGEVISFCDQDYESTCNVSIDADGPMSIKVDLK